MQQTDPDWVIHDRGGRFIRDAEKWRSRHDRLPDGPFMIPRQPFAALSIDQALNGVLLAAEVPFDRLEVREI